jgi:antitoxin HicB
MGCRADDIRAYVARHYVEPARRTGQRTVRVQAGEVVRELGLEGRCPNVCGALDARKFRDSYPVRLVSRTGPRQGHSAAWEFEVLPATEGAAAARAVHTYTVLLRAEPEGGYTVLVPALAGCVTYGETISIALTRAEEAVGCHLRGLRDLGKAVPEEGPVIEVAAEELTGTLLSYRVLAREEVARVA